MYKHVALLVRQSGTTHEAFRDYWLNEHTPIARDIEGVVRYHTVAPTDPEHSEFDGIAELYFEDLNDLHAALDSPGSRDYDPEKGVAAKARADVDNFLATSSPMKRGRSSIARKLSTSSRAFAATSRVGS